MVPYNSAQSEAPEVCILYYVWRELICLYYIDFLFFFNMEITYTYLIFVGQFNATRIVITQISFM